MANKLVVANKSIAPISIVPCCGLVQPNNGTKKCMLDFNSATTIGRLLIFKNEKSQNVYDKQRSVTDLIQKIFPINEELSIFASPPLSDIHDCANLPARNGAYHFVSVNVNELKAIGGAELWLDHKNHLAHGNLKIPKGAVGRALQAEIQSKAVFHSWGYACISCYSGKSPV